MKSYPSISTDVDLLLPYHVFDKLDGSNIRAEWSPKRGFYKFGSRTQLLTPDQKPLWPVVERIVSLESALGAELIKIKAERAVCFFEWHGPNSFAGRHFDAPADMDVALLDISVYKKGLLMPGDVLKLAESAGVKTPRLLRHGKIDQNFLDDVRQGRLSGVSLEGVIGKGAFDKTRGGPVMFKYKSQAWYDRLKVFCAGDVQMFESLR